VCILAILWLARGWLPRAFHWHNGYSQKEIARRLGISSGALGFLYLIAETFWPIIHAHKKKQKRAEEEKEQFSPSYNPIEERNSESWSHERDHD
jgi:hypothetical protein